MPNFALPPDTRTVGQGNPPQDMNAVVDALTAQGAGLNVRNKAWAGGADPTGATDSTTALQAAANGATPGQVVVFPPGIYKISTPLTVPAGVTLWCPGSGGYDAGVWGDNRSGAILQVTPGFTGTAAVLFNDVASAQTQGPAMIGVGIDGAACTATVVDGIRATGPVNATVLRDVLIAGMSGIGINMLQDAGATGQLYPYGWHVYHVKVDSCAAQGIFLQNHTDGVFVDVHVIGNNAHTSGHSWSIPAPCPNTTLIGCKAEWAGNGKDGFHLNGTWATGTGSGGMSFVGCSTDRNDNNGFSVNVTGTVPVIVSGCRFRRDGRNSGNGGSTFAGINVTNSTIPVIIGDCTVFPGVDDNGTGTSSPANGLTLGATNTLVMVSNCLLHGNTAGISGTSGASYRNTWTRTGSTSSPTSPVLQSDTA